MLVLIEYAARRNVHWSSDRRCTKPVCRVLGLDSIALGVGFFIGMVAKKLLSVALILIAIVLLLVLRGFVAPEVFASALNLDSLIWSIFIND